MSLENLRPPVHGSLNNLHDEIAFATRTSDNVILYSCDIRIDLYQVNNSGKIEIVNPYIGTYGTGI